MKKKIILVTVTLSSLLAAAGFVGSTMVFNKGMFVTADGNQVVNGQITFSGSTAVDDNWGHGAYSLSQTSYGNPIYCVAYKNSIAVPNTLVAVMQSSANSYIYFATQKIKYSDKDVTKYAFQCIDSLSITTDKNSRNLIVSYSYDGTNYTALDAYRFETTGTTLDLSAHHPNYIKIEPASNFETRIKEITVNYTCQ